MTVKTFLPDNHVYASDLDLFGTGSLFELLCTARTGAGRAMLAHWLLNPAEYVQARERQMAISEHRGMLDLREDWVSVEGGALDQAGSSVLGWANLPAISFPSYTQAGLVTTHDLALTEVVKAFEGHAINVHFEEHYENGEMRFDYRMRPGVLTRTNGLNVMAAGLLSLPKAPTTDTTAPNPTSKFD